MTSPWRHSGVRFLGSVLAASFALTFVAPSRVHAAPSLYDESLSEAAARLTPPLHARVVDEVRAFTKDTLPHESKDLRKSIGKLRDHLDLLSHVYSDDGPGDPWKELRDGLDEGYEAFGSYKDLFDSQGLVLAIYDSAAGTWSEGVRPEDVDYDEAKLKQRRAAVLKWRKKFVEEDAVAARAAYLSAPLVGELEERLREDLSRFFWGVPRSKVSLDATAGGNLAHLADVLLALARRELETLDDVRDLVHPDNEAVFHDFRKRVRTVVKIVGYFPELASGGEAAPHVETLTLAVGRFGDIEDQIVAYHLAVEDGKEARAKKLAKRIKTDWKELREWLGAVGVDDRLRGLARCLVLE